MPRPVAILATSVLATSVPAAAPTRTQPNGALPPALLAAPDATRFLGISNATLWRKVKAGDLPRPIKIGRCTRWRRADLEAWITARPVAGAEP